MLYQYCCSWKRIILLAFALSDISFAFVLPSTTAPSSQATTTSTSALYVGSTNPAAGELTNQLARLDRQWRIQQRRQEWSRWTKLVLNPDRERELRPGFMQDRRDDDAVYLLEPPYRTIPACIILFTGGAGLGTYPHVAYNEFLLRLSNRMNAAIITAPYPVGLDHKKLANSNGKLLQRAIRHCQQDRSRLYPTDIPVFSLGHSLGSKLSCVFAADHHHQDDEINFQGHGYISFNNFGFDQTFTMAKKLGETFRLNTGLSRNMEHEMLVDGFFSVAERLVRVSQMEFSPSPPQTLSLIRHRFANKQQRILKTRLFTFDDDNMDSSRDFVEACGSQRRPDVSALPGKHLTPVFFRLGLGDAPNSSNTATASFGKEDDLQALVNEVCRWIHGAPPTREPSWVLQQRAPSTTTTQRRQRRPQATPLLPDTTILQPTR